MGVSAPLSAQKIIFLTPVSLKALLLQTTFLPGFKLFVSFMLCSEFPSSQSSGQRMVAFLYGPDRKWDASNEDVLEICTGTPGCLEEN